MRSGISFFNSTIWKKTFLRFWPIWAVNLVIWVMAFPLNSLSQMMRYGSSAVWDISENICDYVQGLLPIYALCIGLVTAMAVCSHLYSSRSANFFGALPVRREGLFVSTYLAGLCIMVLPNLAVFVLMLLVEFFANAVFLAPLLFWLVMLSLMEFFFFSAAVFCGMFAGHILALPAFYAVLNSFAMAFYYLAVWALSYFYYGFANNMDGMPMTVAEWLTPVLALSRVECSSLSVSASSAGMDATLKSTISFAYSGVTELVVYTVAGLFFLGFSLLLYQRRNLESAGDVVSVRVMRPVFRHGVAICAGFLLGLVTMGILDLGEFGLMVSIVIWGAVGSFAAQMLLDKSYRVFHKWKGAVGTTVVFLLIFLVVGFDLTGFETRIPDLEQVEYATVTGLGNDPWDSGSYWQNVRVTDEDDLEMVLQLHELAVEDRDTDRNGRPVGEDGDYWTYWNFYVTYYLKNGSSMVREYQLWDTNRSLEQEGTIFWTVQRLVDDRDLARRCYGIDDARTMLEYGGRLESVTFSPGGDIPVEYYGFGEYADTNVETYSSDDLYIYGGDALDVWQAVCRDFDAGLIGMHNAVNSDADESNLNRLVFSFRLSDRTAAANGATLPLEWTNSNVCRYEDENGNLESNIDIGIAVPGTAAETIAALARLGYKITDG